METTPREAREALLLVEQAKITAARHSLNNGSLLIVWGDAFLLDMIAAWCCGRSGMSDGCQ